MLPWQRVLEKSDYTPLSNAKTFHNICNTENTYTHNTKKVNKRLKTKKEEDIFFIYNFNC